jgi:hypothetical protein
MISRLNPAYNSIIPRRQPGSIAPLYAPLNWASRAGPTKQLPLPAITLPSFKRWIGRLPGWGELEFHHPQSAQPRTLGPGKGGIRFHPLVNLAEIAGSADGSGLWATSIILR